MIGRANHLHSHKNHHSPEFALKTSHPGRLWFHVGSVCVCVWSKQRFAKSLPVNVADLHSGLGREARRKLYTKPLLR